MRFQIGLKAFLILPVAVGIAAGILCHILFRNEVVSQAKVPVYPGLRPIPKTDPHVPSRSLGKDWNFLYDGEVNQDVLNEIVSFYKSLYPDAETSDWTENYELRFEFRLATNHPVDTTEITIWSHGLVQIMEHNPFDRSEVANGG